MTHEETPIENPIAIVVRRGERAECWHRAAWCVWRGNDVVHSRGSAAASYFMRSAAKFFQALAALREGIAERYQLDASAIALACASHGGEPMHVERAAGMLAAGGFGAVDLACGPHLPMHVPSAAELIVAGESPSPLHNNCSGKHAAMLLATRLRGESSVDYVDPEHPHQRRIRAVIEEFTAANREDLEVMIDGCSAPTFRVPLNHAARAFAEFAARASRSDGFEARIWDSIAAHPLMIAGHERFCSALIAATGGRVLAKIGADGFFGAMCRQSGVGLALHVDDGGAFVSEVLVLALLRRLGLVSAKERTDLERWWEPVRRNHAGLEVGRIDFDLGEIPRLGD